MNDLFCVSGKHIFITGASSGLGAHFADVLSVRGARLSLAARRFERLQSQVDLLGTHRCSAYPIEMDVANSDSVTTGFAAAQRQFGPVDVLINNAGIASSTPVLKMHPSEWRHVIDVNLNGAWYAAQQAARQMVESGNGGSIVNITSILSYRAAKGSTPYASSKAAFDHLTRMLALEWARYNIRVNAIAPGYIHSEMTEKFLQTEAGQKTVANIPQQRVGDPQDLDGALLLLVSDASRYMNGTTIVVDGGHLQSSL